MTAACPDCSGQRMARHPAGPLTFDHSLACDVRRAEDSRRVADADLVAEAFGWECRDATLTELELLAVLGVDSDRVGRVIVTQETAGGAIVRRTFLDADGAPIDPDITEEATL